MQPLRQKGSLNRIGISSIRHWLVAFLATVLFATSGFAQKDAPQGADVDSVKARAEKGDVVARTALGMIYCYGRGVMTRKPAEGLRLLQRAAEQGNVAA